MLAQPERLDHGKIFPEKFLLHIIFCIIFACYSGRPVLQNMFAFGWQIRRRRKASFQNLFLDSNEHFRLAPCQQRSTNPDQFTYSSSMYTISLTAVLI